MFLVLVFLFIFCIVMMYRRNILFSPAGIFALLWIMFSLLSISFLHNKYEFTYKGISWILVAVLLYLLPSLFLFDKNKNKGNVIEDTRTKKEADVFWPAIYILTILAFGSNVLTICRNNISLSAFTNISDWQALTHSLSDKHYAGTIGTSTLELVFNVFVYTLPLCCGFSIL